MAICTVRFLIYTEYNNTTQRGSSTDTNRLYVMASPPYACTYWVEISLSGHKELGEQTNEWQNIAYAVQRLHYTCFLRPTSNWLQVNLHCMFCIPSLSPLPSLQLPGHTYQWVTAHIFCELIMQKCLFALFWKPQHVCSNWLHAKNLTIRKLNTIKLLTKSSSKKWYLIFFWNFTYEVECIIIWINRN